MATESGVLTDFASLSTTSQGNVLKTIFQAMGDTNEVGFFDIMHGADGRWMQDDIPDGGQLNGFRHLQPHGPR